MSFITDRIKNTEFYASGETVGLLDLPFDVTRTTSNGRVMQCSGSYSSAQNSSATLSMSSIIKSAPCAGPSQIADLAAERPLKCRLMKNQNGGYSLACKSGLMMY